MFCRARLHNRWTFPKAGTSGPLKNGADCVVIAPNANGNDDITLMPCDGSAEQSFQIDANGNVHITGDTKRCLAIYDFNGPGVVSWSCNTGSNEEFNTAADTICSKGGYCLAARSNEPPGGGADGQPTDIQIWAKPQVNCPHPTLHCSSPPSAPPPHLTSLHHPHFTAPHHLTSLQLTLPHITLHHITSHHINSTLHLTTSLH
jgi:hypothetical protein